MRKLYRSNTDKVFCGVCGGIAQYMDTDPTAIRLVWIIVTIFTGFFPGILAYIIACFIMQKNPDKKK